MPGVAAGIWLVVAAVGALAITAQQPRPAAPASAELRHGRVLLQTKQFVAAKELFRGYLRTHPSDVQAELGLGDAELGLREYEAAEASYREVVSQQPELWQAHKNLVVVEAALGRWEDFDGERTVLRLARQRGAPGISAQESDVIDTFNVNGQTWVVRAYFEPVGRSEAVYNFEQFGPGGRAETYISLENAAAAQAALQPDDVRIGAAEPPGAKQGPQVFALNWYTAHAHGTILRYPMGQPSYETVRAAVIQWLKVHRPRP